MLIDAQPSMIDMITSANIRLQQTLRSVIRHWLSFHATIAGEYEGWACFQEKYTYR
jgi:hypothetical protein